MKVNCEDCKKAVALYCFASVLKIDDRGNSGSRL